MHPEIPRRWQERLEAYLRKQGEETRTHLSASDFRHSVSLRFADGSYALFRNAFYLASEELGEIVVFTEHCGYHVFPRYGTQVDLMETLYPDEPT